MSPRWHRAAWQLCPLLLMAACAVGYDGAGSDYSEPDPAAGLPPFMGEACSPVGDRVVCACASGGMGLRACVQNPSSPTKGALTECLNCMTPMTPRGMAGTNQGDAPMESGTGGRGSGAAGGRASGRGDAAAGGTGSSTSGGGRAGSAARSGGSSGSGGRSSGGACNCDNSCFPIGILACCRGDGSCGCTWAPGAYCS